VAAIVVTLIAVNAIVAGRWLIRDRVVRPLNDRYGPMPMWLVFAIIAGLIIWRLSRIDDSTIGMLHLLSLITFVICVVYLVWPRSRN